MRRAKQVVWVAVLLVVATAWAGPNPRSKEPPQLFILEVGGKPMPIQLGKPYSIEAGGKRFAIKLTARDYRVLTAEGVRFRYPRGLAFAYDEEGGVPSWSLDGSEYSIMLHVQPAADAAETLAAMAEAMVTEYGNKRCTSQETSIILSGRKVAGRRVETTMAGQRTRQDVFVFEHGVKTYVAILQSLPEEGVVPADAVAAFKMFAESFSFLPVIKR